MPTLILFIFLWLIVKACKAVFRRGKRRTQSKRSKATAPAPAASKVSRSLAALEVLQAQRDELQDQLDLVNAALDAAPPEDKRIKWMKERTRIYGQLATCESKISRLCYGA